MVVWITLGCSLASPARVSTYSFPCIPRWDGTHCKKTLPCLSRNLCVVKVKMSQQSLQTLATVCWVNKDCTADLESVTMTTSPLTSCFINHSTVSLIPINSAVTMELHGSRDPLPLARIEGIQKAVPTAWSVLDPSV